MRGFSKSVIEPSSWGIRDFRSINFFKKRNLADLIAYYSFFVFGNYFASKKTKTFNIIYPLFRKWEKESFQISLELCNYRSRTLFPSVSHNP